MDLMRLVRSLEEFLYAVMTWLIFYPRTFWRIVTSPGATGEQIKAELAKPSEQQFSDMISPPLFLVLTIFLFHLVELRLDEAPDRSSLTPLATEMLGSEQLLLLFRAVIYSLFPLLMASTLLKGRGEPIDRETLRSPFFAQCYFIVPLVTAEALATIFVRAHTANLDIAAAIVMAVSIAWYLRVQSNWFHAERGVSRARGLAIALAVTLAAAFLGFLLAAAILMDNFTG